MLNRTHVGDCRTLLREFAAAGLKAQTCVTSPPYWGLRDYGVEGQIGLEPTLDAWVGEMVEVFRGVREVLAQDGTLFLNLGDAYCGHRRGAGGSFSSERPGWREAPYGTSGKEPANSTAYDCLCGNLCDACQLAYRIGRSHICSQRVPTPSASASASNLLRTELPSSHLPTSDLTRQVDHSEAATLSAGITPGPADERIPSSQESMLHESSALHREGSRRSGQASVCRLCGRSLQSSAQVFARREACSCDTLAHGSAYGIAGMDASGLASVHLTTASLKPKDLLGMPWRVAFALQADGWFLRSDIIWSKLNPMPESVTDRPTKAHEYVFLLSKSERYHYDADSIGEPRSSVNIEAFTSSTPRDKGDRKRFRGGGKYTNNQSFSPGKKPNVQNGNRDVSSASRNCRSVWTMATEPYAEAHFATFPTALVKRCILAGSSSGDVVLDPFMGSGTTAQVATSLGRQFLGCELNAAYIDLHEHRKITTGFAF